MSVHPSSVHNCLIPVRVARVAGLYTQKTRKPRAGITPITPYTTVNHAISHHWLQVILKADAIYISDSFKFFPLPCSTAAKPNWSRHITPLCNNLGCNNC